MTKRRPSYGTMLEPWGHEGVYTTYSGPAPATTRCGHTDHPTADDALQCIRDLIGDDQ